MMKKIIVSAVVFTGLIFSAQALAQTTNNTQNNNNNNQNFKNLEGYYINTGIGLAHNNDHDHINFTGLFGGGYLQRAVGSPVDFVWGGEADFQHFGDSAYGVNGDAVADYQFTKEISAYGKAGVLMAHADGNKMGLQFGGGAGYMVMPSVRATFEIVHSFVVLGGITSYTAGLQYLMG